MRLQNNKLAIEINTFGAELQSIQANNKEYLWQGNPTYWKRRSPILFPIVGRLLDNEYTLDGVTYSLTQHGFARDNEFTLLESLDTKAVYLLQDNETTLLRYPYKFDLYITYELVDKTVVVTWKVINTNQKEMYFAIGAHPAFNFLNGSEIVINKTTSRYELNATPYVHEVVEKVKTGIIPITNDTFVNDAIILDKVDTLILQDSNKAIEMDCTNFPYLGLWTSITEGVNAPFICLEPWHGIADFMSHTKDLKTKIGMNKLLPNEEFNAEYKIKIRK